MERATEWLESQFQQTDFPCHPQLKEAVWPCLACSAGHSSEERKKRLLDWRCTNRQQHHNANRKMNAAQDGDTFSTCFPAASSCCFASQNGTIQEVADNLSRSSLQVQESSFQSMLTTDFTRKLASQITLKAPFPFPPTHPQRSQTGLLETLSFNEDI